MFDRIAANTEVLGLAISVCTLLVWIAYAQLLYAGFRRQRRPSLMLNRGHGRGLDALCVVGNMSAEGIFVQYVIAELETDGDTVRMDITDRRTSADGGDSGNEDDRGGRDDTDDNASSARTTSVLSELTYQGPLQSNGTFHLGSFGHLIERLLTQDGREEPLAKRGDTQTWRLTVRLIASYGPEDRPVGAERTFRITSSVGGVAVVPDTWDTRRLSSRAERRELERLVRQIHQGEQSAIAAGERVTGRDRVEPSGPAR